MSRPGRIRSRRADVLGILIFFVVAVAVGAGTFALDPVDLRVYHLAAGHLQTDDVYDHMYPQWPFVYPPSALVLLYPVVAPLQVARLCLYAASLASVWVTLHLVARASAPETAWSRPAAVAGYATLTLLSWPLLLGLGLGQVAPIVMGLTAMGMLGRRNRWRAAWVGTATAIKLTPALFILHLWMTRRRVDALIGAGTVLAWFAVGAALMPSSSWAYVTGGVSRANDWHAHDPANLSNQALTGVAARLGLDSPEMRFAVVALGAALLVVALVVAKRLFDAGWEAAAVCLLGVWTAVAAPVGWIHAFGWWVPLAVSVGLTGRQRRDIAVAVTIAVVPLILLLGHLGGWLGDSLPSALQKNNYAMLAAGVTVWLWWRVGQGRAPRTSQSALVTV